MGKRGKRRREGKGEREEKGEGLRRRKEGTVKGKGGLYGKFAAAIANPL